MKCTMINFLLFIIFINYLSLTIYSQQLDTIDKHKLIQCKLCQEMFKFNFNFDEMLKSKKIENIKKVFDSLEEQTEEVKNYFSKDNLEFVLKEISMQYFFRGGDSLFETEENKDFKFKECKESDTPNEICDKSKLKVCEKVLSFEEGICSNLRIHLKNIMTNNLIKNKKNIKKTSLNLNRDDENTGKQYEVDKLRKQDPDNIINYPKFQFKQTDKDPDVIKQFGDISLLEMTPEYIKNNFDSIPKSHWKPPKPVLLQNFERNIGDQLKDISSLASEISKMENKLKSLKQQLANKLEIAQSSYNVVQKTLVEISKLVNQPQMSASIKSPSTFTEDDWDESSKPKFLNK